jgi:hypothetical protein
MFSPGLGQCSYRADIAKDRRDPETVYRFNYGLYPCFSRLQ